MPQSYRQISPQLAHQIRLVMTDVDGTITTGGDSISPAVSHAIRRLEDQGIIVGLVSGRTLPKLESMAHDFGITGPIIAENGGVAKIKVNRRHVDLGYSRQPALEALAKLKELYPKAIEELASQGVNLYVTGVSSLNENYQPSIDFHEIAKKLKINVLAGTHYSTEKFACIAMTEYFSKLGINSKFIDGQYYLEDLE